MKKFLIIFSLAFGLMFWSSNTFAQAFPPPNHGSTGDQSGSGAPIGTGAVILLGLGAAYGGKKYHEMKNTPREEE